MKLTNKVTNVFFGIIAVIGLFMPIVGYSTMLTGDSFNIVDMINFLKGIDPNADTSLLSNLGKYGFKEEAVLVAVFFIIMLVCLALTLIFGFINVPVLAITVVTGLGLGSYITAAAAFVKIGAAFVKGIIPVSAITSLSSTGDAGGDILSALIGSFASVSKMGLAAGAYVGIACFAVLFLVNLVFFIFRKRFALMDGEKPKEKKSKKSKKSKKA